MWSVPILIIGGTNESSWWQNFMKEYDGTQNRAYMREVYKSYHATPIDDGQRMLGLQFESDHYRTLFLLKYG
jgi:hypothetical protein